MSLVAFDSRGFEDYVDRPKRPRYEQQKSITSSKVASRLELDGVIKVLRNYNDYEGGINCSICGKLYKSRVCFTKHIWEHSIYWDLFEGSKNHDRVLSIQAALILYGGHLDVLSDENTFISSLLVTSPHQPGDKKKDALNSSHNSSDFSRKTAKKASPSKRKRTFNSDDDDL